MTSVLSSIEEINNVIKDHNPFDRALVVKQNDIWNNSFPDCISINAHASDIILNEIKKVQTGKRTSIGITITAEKGLGKSHIISRIRQHLQSQEGTLFLYIADFNDLQRLNSTFLQTLARSLKQEGSQQVSQWQEIATVLVNEVSEQKFKPKELVNKEFPRLLTQALAEGKEAATYISELSSKILEYKPNITDDPYLIQALLWTLSKSNIHFAISWLCGKGLSKTKSDEMGLPNHYEEISEASAFSSICQIFNLISAYKTLVICFDELDSVTGNTDIIFTKAMVIASLIKEIYNLTNKGIFLTVMYPQTLSCQVRAMPQAEAVIARIGEKIIDLSYLNSDDIVNLVKMWLKDFYDRQGLVPLDILYPFDESQLRDLGKKKPTIREALQWCRNNFILVPPKHPVENAFNKELSDMEILINNYFDDKYVVASAIKLCFLSLINQSIAEIKIDSVEDFKFGIRERDNSPDFKIIGKDKGEIIKIGLMVHQNSSSSSIQAGLRKIIDYRKLDITHGCLIRSKKISNSARKTQEYLLNLRTKNGKWIKLLENDIKPLLAILLVYKSKDDYELSEEQIFDFMNIKRLAIDNSLILDILTPITN